MSHEFKLVLTSVENPDSTHLVEELAQRFSIDEETSRSILTHAPIVLLDNVSVQVAAAVKTKLNKMIALGARLVITDDELELMYLGQQMATGGEELEDVPRVNWPELPEIALEAESALPASASPPEGSKEGDHPASIKLATLPGAESFVFVCPSCESGFEMRRLKEDAMEGIKENFSSAPVPPSNPEETSSEDSAISEGAGADQIPHEESSLDIEGIELSPEKVLPGESSEILTLNPESGLTSALNPEDFSPENFSTSTEAEDLSKEAEKTEETEAGESSVELEPEDSVIEFNTDSIQTDEALKEMESSEIEPAQTQSHYEEIDSRRLENVELEGSSLDLEEIPDPLAENFEEDGLVDLEEELGDEFEEEDDDDDSISMGSEFEIEEGAPIEIEESGEMASVEELEELKKYADEEDFTPAAEEAEDEDFASDEEEIVEEEEEESAVDLEALAPDPDWGETSVESEDFMSVLDSDEDFPAVEDTSSDELLLEEMLPLYEAPSEPLDPEEALRLLQQNKDEEEEEDFASAQEGSEELETLDPQEALNLLMQTTGGKKSASKKKKSSRPSSASSPKFQKLQTKKRKTTSKTKVAEGKGPHGVVLSRITGDDKKEQAAEIIADLKSIPVDEAMAMTNKMIIPVLKGVTKDVAEVAKKRFKSAGISVKVTTRKR